MLRSWHWSTKWLVLVGLPCLGILLWSEDQQLPKTGAVDISLTENGLGKLLRLPPADTPLPEHLLPPLTTFSTMVQRPLFTPDRRDQPLVDPHQPPVVEEVDWLDTPTYPDIEFVGTVTDGDDFRAFINDQHGVRSVAVGQTIDGWRVMKIDARIIMLERDSEELRLNILGINQ